ncbi:MAG: transposase [Zetaproteobacteria bacterium]|nr:transposase [Zetaproteobacteria bacterium]
MIIRKGFKYRLEPSAAQRADMVMFAGHNRAVWNKDLALTKDRLERKIPISWYHELNWNMTNFWKKSDEMNWLNDAPSQCLQQTLKQFDRAMRDCFDKNQPNKRMPRFKKKGVKDSFLFPQGISFEGNRIKLPKLGWVKFRKSRDLEEKLKSATVSRNGKHWFVSILCEIEVAEPVHTSNTAVGIDRGVAIMAACSDGREYIGAKAFKKHEKKLARAGRLLARKVKFSNNWQKQKEKVQNIHSKIANIRKDALHKASTDISKNHAMIVMEKLGVSRMSKSAKGNSEKHGSNVKAKSGLNKSILDAGWAMFAAMLEYKQAWLRGMVEYVPAAYTSQRCSECGHTVKANRLSQSKFQCVQCNHAENADFNAAKNILAAGHAVLACGVGAVVTTMKQEPLAV